MVLLRVIEGQPLSRMRMGCSELPQVKQGGGERPVRFQPVPGVVGFLGQRKPLLPKGCSGVEFAPDGRTYPESRVYD